MNELQIFNNEEFGEIRTIMIDNEPWFVAADVCKALEIGDTHKAVERLDVDEKGRSSIPTPGGTQELLTVNEPGLYTLVLGSRKPEAKAFKRWVTHDVIPEIRKTGSYHLPQTYSEALRALADKAEEAEQLKLENDLMKPKAEYFDELVDRKLLTNFRDTAKELKVKPKAFMKFLYEHKYIYRSSEGVIKPYSKKNDGLFELKEFKSLYSDHAGLQTMITAKGREVFRRLIK